MRNFIQFDTRNKKPKLYNMLILAVIVLIIISLLIFHQIEKHELFVSVILDVFYVIALYQLISAFFKQIQYNPYSYNTIYYMGFSLFLISVLITGVLQTYQLFRYPDIYHLNDVVNVLYSSAKNYMLISAPFILIFSIALCISNISLIRHEGKRFVNFLGILLSFMLIAGEIFLFIADYYVTGSLWEVMCHDLLTNLFAAFYLYCECMLIGAMVADVIAARYEPEKNKDFLIILGCGLRKDGTPTPLLQGRIDRALAFYQKQKEGTGKELMFVTSGGKGADEVISECESMKRYLMEQGIPESRIIEEDQSTDTFENMKFSKEKILAVNPEGKVAFSTTNYHVFRSGLYARRVKMRAVGMGSKTKWYFWPNASVRELIGLFTEHRLKQAVVLTSMIVIYALLTYMNYMY